MVRPLFTAALLVATSVAAQQTISDTVSFGGPDEVEAIAPMPCCTAGIVPAGHFEVETNCSGDTAGVSFVHTSNLTLKYSFTDRLQVQVGSPNFLVGGVDTTRHSFDGLVVGAKYVLRDEGELAPILSASAHLIIPTWTDDDAYQPTFDVQAWFYASKTLGALTFDATLTASVVNLLGELAPRGGASLTATWNFSQHWGLSTGPYGFFGDPAKVTVDGGFWASLNYNPIPQIAFSAGVEAGFVPTSRAFSVFAGVAFVPTAMGDTPLAKAPVAPPQQLLAAR